MGKKFLFVIIVLLACGIGLELGILLFKDKEVNIIDEASKAEMYKDYIKFGISNRKGAVPVTIYVNSKPITYILGIDDILYKEGGEILIPGSDVYGTPISNTRTVRVFDINYNDTKAFILIKRDGTSTIMKNIINDDYTEEKLDRNYVIDVYTTMDGSVYTVNIFGNSTKLKEAS